MNTDISSRRDHLLTQSQAVLTGWEYLEQFEELEQRESELTEKVHQVVEALEAQDIQQWYRRHGTQYGPMLAEESNIECLFEDPRHATAVLLVRYSRSDSHSFKWRVEDEALIGEVSYKDTGRLCERLVVLKDPEGFYYIYLAWVS